MWEFLGIIVVALGAWYIHSSSLAKKRQATLAFHLDLDESEFRSVFGVAPSQKVFEELAWSIASSNGYEIILREFQTYAGLRNSLEFSEIVVACVPDWSANLKRRFPSDRLS